MVFFVEGEERCVGDAWRGKSVRWLIVVVGSCLMREGQVRTRLGCLDDFLLTVREEE